MGVASGLAPASSPALWHILRWRVSGSRLRGLRRLPFPCPGAPHPISARALDSRPAQPRVDPCVSFDFSEIPLYFVDLQDDLDRK